MGQQTLRRVLPQILRFLDAQAGRKQTDGRLLEQFITQRDAVAFAVLVERHGPMVLRVCRAHSETPTKRRTPSRLPSWCWRSRRRRSPTGVAGQLAVRRGPPRRRQGRGAIRPTARPRSIGGRCGSCPSAPAAEWTEFRGILDEELSRLPELYRRPFVLCCLEEKTQEQAAAELWLPAEFAGVASGPGKGGFAATVDRTRRCAGGSNGHRGSDGLRRRPRVRYFGDDAGPRPRPRPGRDESVFGYSFYRYFVFDAVRRRGSGRRGRPGAACQGRQANDARRRQRSARQRPPPRRKPSEPTAMAIPCRRAR